MVIRLSVLTESKAICVGLSGMPTTTVALSTMTMPVVLDQTVSEKEV